MNEQTHNRDDSHERTNLLCSLAKEKVTNHGEGKEKMRSLLNLGVKVQGLKVTHKGCLHISYLIENLKNSSFEDRFYPLHI